MLRSVLLGLGLALVVVPVSELMFWPVRIDSIPGLVLFYGMSVLLAALLLERSGARGWPAYVLAGGIFGWLIEGVVVSQTYEAVPFSLSWTPLAWHMVLSVMGALVGLGWALRRGLVAALLACAVVGAFAGLWGAYGWTELVEDVTTVETGLPFEVQITVAAALMATGHCLLSRLPDGRAPGWLLWVLLGMAVLVWALAWAVPLFPMSLNVPALIGVSIWALSRAGRGAVAMQPYAPVPWVRFLAFGVIPLVAVPVQGALLDVAWLAEANAFVAGPLVLFGTGAWIAALGISVWRGARGRALP